MGTIYLFGDSIGQGVVYDPQRSRYRFSPVRCAKQLVQAGLPVENHAMMGRTIGQGYDEFCHTKTENGGLCVIEFGGNDCDLDWDAISAEPTAAHLGRTPLPDFRAAIARFIADARARSLTPVLVTPPPLMAGRFYDWICRGRDSQAILRYLGDVEHIYRWQERYARAVREAAWEHGCRLLDLRGAFLDAPNLPDLIGPDGMHPTDAGQMLMTQVALGELGAAV